VVDIGVMAYWSVKVLTKLKSQAPNYLEFRNAPKEQ
jgi:hypothetical protein